MTRERDHSNVPMTANNPRAIRLSMNRVVMLRLVMTRSETCIM